MQHRTKGPGVPGATPEQPIGPFGRWSDGSQDEVNRPRIGGGSDVPWLTWSRVAGL
jgi:hypothetical protein